MGRKSLVALVCGATAAVAMALASPVEAAGPPVGGCPTGGGWRLAPLGITLPIDVGNFHDQNGDGWICFRVNPGQTTKNNFQSWTVKDNTNPL